MRNLQARLEAEGSGLDGIVWASWALRDPSDFDMFDEEWVRWFPGEAPVGQTTLMTPTHRRAGFRVSIGVIAEADHDAGPRATGDPARGDLPAARASHSETPRRKR
jgi:enamine deaminase RidA (YjgF/YER057c/UK114 family)